MIGEDTTDTLLAVLDHERQRVDDLHYRVVTLHRLVEAGDLDLLDRANADVERALDRVRETELLRGVVVGALLAEHGHDDPVGTLADVMAVIDTTKRPRLRHLAEHLARRSDEVERIGARAHRRADLAASDLQDLGAVIGAPAS